MTEYSFLLPLILVIYLLIIDFVDLYPFNDVTKRKRHDRIAEIINYLLFSCGAFCSWYGGTLAYIALAIAGLGIVGHIFAWYAPYFFGHWSEFSKQEYEFSFSKTIKILPPIKNNPIPDLEHMPVGILVVAWFVIELYKILY